MVLTTALVGGLVVLGADGGEPGGSAAHQSAVAGAAASGGLAPVPGAIVGGAAGGRATSAPGGALGPGGALAPGTGAGDAAAEGSAPADAAGDSGGAGAPCTAVVTDPAPPDGAQDDVIVHHLAPGSSVTITFAYAGQPSTYSATADASGMVVLPFVVGQPPPGQAVTVTVAGGGSGCTASFTPSG